MDGNHPSRIRPHHLGAHGLQRAVVVTTTNVYLTHFFGDWAKEMLSPITEQITPGTKILDSKIGVRADQFKIRPSCSRWTDRRRRTRGRVLAGSLEWSGSFQCAFDDNGRASAPCAA